MSGSKFKHQEIFVSIIIDVTSDNNQAIPPPESISTLFMLKHSEEQTINEKKWGKWMSINGNDGEK